MLIGRRRYRDSIWIVFLTHLKIISSTTNLTARHLFDARSLNMPVQKPTFQPLPLRPDVPRGNAWGLFGEHDEMGMLNLLTPENTAGAAREIVEGVRVSTD
jgi:hypothetical protein